MKPSLKAKLREQIDPFSTSIIEDLLQGATDWRPIDDIVKLTFKALTDVVKVQSEAIRELKSAMPAKASKSELTTGLSLKANTSDVSRTIAEISNVLEAKIGISQFHTVMKDYVTRYDVQTIMTSKVNVEDVKQIFMKLPERPLPQRTDPVLQTRFEQLQREVGKRLSNFVSVGEFQQLLSIVDQKANVSEINEALELKVSKQALTASLQKKLSKADLDLYLSKKADISDLEYIVNNLETKVDLSTIEKLTQVIENKCDKSDLSLFMSGLNDKSDRAELELVVQGVDELKTRMEKHMLELDARISPEGSIRKKIQHLQDSVNHVMSKQSGPGEAAQSMTTLKYELLQQINKGRQSTKQMCDDMNAKLRDTMDSQQISIKELISDVNHWKRKEDKLYEEIDDVRRRSEQLTAKGVERREFSELKSTVLAALQHKPEAPEVQALVSKLEGALLGKVSEDKQEILRLMQSVEKSLSGSIAEVSAEVLHVSSTISKKQDRHQHHAGQQLVRKVKKEVQECRKICDKVLSEMHSKLNTSEYENDLIEIRRRLDGFQKEIANKANIKDVCVLADSKPNIEQVNKALKQIHEQLDKKVADDQLKTVVQDQATINETLCSENIIGRWLWHSGEIRAGSLVPWESESVNTLPDNFLWDKDKTSILTLASGMYEINVCFFCRSRPIISIIVNGQSVLSRSSNSSEDKQNQNRKRKQKDVVGVRLTEYLMLPPRARLSISYNGEHGAEGFLNLKRF